VIIADSTTLTDYILAKTIWLVDGMVVSPARMLKNLQATRGLVFSGQVLLDLAAAGMLRETAYKTVQSHAMRCWQDDMDLKEALSSDPEVRKYMTTEQLEKSFALQNQLANVDAIFHRVFQVA
jgi:adenylosuccinate lyase